MKKNRESITEVDIRPGVQMLSVLSNLNYRPWYALAEFVDNAVQSFLTNRKRLSRGDGTTTLKVEIEIDAAKERITVLDNAAGITLSEFPRAFRPAEPPPDRTGLSEHGMGMKSAACWFARNWAVRTTALGEAFERIISFDIDRIVAGNIERLYPEVRRAKPEIHYTELVLSKLHHGAPQGKTLAKIRDHLAGIYRVYLRQGLLDLRINGIALQYEEPQVLFAPRYNGEKEKPREWRVPLDFEVEGKKVTGFAAIREKASISTAGFAVIRRNRLILGSGDEPYRPEALLGKANKFAYQRVYGELHVDGFRTSYTKDGLVWGDAEDKLISALKKKLTSPTMPLLQQAENYRVRPKPGQLGEMAVSVAERTASLLEREAPPVLEKARHRSNLGELTPTDLPSVKSIEAKRKMVLELKGATWIVDLELTADPSVADKWVSISDAPTFERKKRGLHRRIGIRIALAHPFMVRFAADESSLEPIVRIGVGLILSEICAKESNTKIIGAVRENLNDLMAKVLHKPCT